MPSWVNASSMAADLKTMDKEAFFKALLCALTAFMVWTLLRTLFLPPQPSGPAPGSSPTTAAVPTSAPTAPESIDIRGADQEELIGLGNLTVSTLGASIASARLSDHATEVGSTERYEIVKPIERTTGHALYSLTTQGIYIDGVGDLPLGDRVWQHRPESSNEGPQAIFWLDFVRNGQDDPFARLTKTITLKNQRANAGHNDVRITLGFENFSAEPINLIVTQAGPVGVPMADPKTDYRKVAAGIADGTTITLKSYPNTNLKPNPPTLDPLLDAEHATKRLDWAAVANKFFVVIVAPLTPEGQPNWIAAAHALRATHTEEEKNDATFELITTPAVVQPQGTWERSFDCYFGPKSKRLFESEPEYVQRQYVKLVSADYYWCAWAPVVNVMVWLMDTSYSIVPNYGVAIIVMVLIVRVLLHPVTKKGQVNMTRMQTQMSTLQPKMEEIRKKHANDKTKVNQEVMKLYQREGINPAGQMLTCLPMFLQMPIWGALWAALNFTVEMRHQPFILWIKDLTAADSAFRLPWTLPLMGDTVNVLPLLLGISMWLQQRFMPKPATTAGQSAKTNEQMAQQRMMMAFMSVFMVFIFYHAPSGLNLYIMASNFFGLFEQHRIRKHLKEQEGGGTAGVVGKDGPKPPTSGTFKKPRFLEKLEKMAEDAKKR